LFVGLRTLEQNPKYSYDTTITSRTSKLFCCTRWCRWLL